MRSLSALITSFYSLAVYREATQNWKGVGLTLIFLGSLITTVAYSVPMWTGMNELGRIAP